MYELNLVLLFIISIPPCLLYYQLFYLFLPITITVMSLFFITKWSLQRFKSLQTNKYFKRFNESLLLILILLYIVMWFPPLFGEASIINSNYPFYILGLALFTFILKYKTKLIKYIISIVSVAFIIFILMQYFKGGVSNRLDAYYFSTILFIIIISEVILYYFIKREIKSLNSSEEVKSILQDSPLFITTSLIMNITFLFLTLNFYLPVNDSYDNLNKLSGPISKIFDYKASDAIGNIIGKQIMFIKEGCNPNTLLIGSRGKSNSGLVKYNSKLRTFISSPVPDQSPDDILIDCKNKQVITAEFDCNEDLYECNYVSKLYFLSLDNWPELKKTPIILPEQITSLIYSEKDHLIYLLTEGSEILVLDLKTSKIIAYYERPDEWLYFPTHDLFVVFTEPDYLLEVIKFNKKDKEFKILDKVDLDIPIYKRLTMFPYYDYETRRFYLSSMWEGNIRIFNNKLDYIGKFELEKGVRNLAAVPNLPVLAVVNYGKGFLSFIDIRNYHLLKKIFIGYRARAINFSSDNKFMYIGTTEGGLKIDLSWISK